MLFEARCGDTTELVSGCGQLGVSAETLGTRAGKAMKYFLSSQATVGRHLADQLLVPMALAGEGVFTTVPCEQPCDYKFEGNQAVSTVEV